MLGRYNALFLGPVNIGGTFYALSVVFFVGILIITGALIGQASGAKKLPYDGADCTGGQYVIHLVWGDFIRMVYAHRTGTIVIVV